MSHIYKVRINCSNFSHRCIALHHRLSTEIKAGKGGKRVLNVI